MTRDQIRVALDGAIEYLTQNPASARYTDSPATARLADPGALRVDVAGPDGVTLVTDMPASVGGASSTASAGWYLRAAMAACVATLIAMRAAHTEMVLEDVEVTVDSVSDDRGIVGADDSVPAGPLSSRVAVRIRAGGEDEMSLRELVEWAVGHCPVTDAVRRAVPLTVEVEIAWR